MCAHVWMMEAMMRWETERDQRKTVQGRNEKGMKRFTNDSWSHEKIHVSMDECMQISVSPPYRLLASNICFFLVYDVYGMYVALRCTSVPCLEQGHPTFSDSDRNVNNARVSVRQPCVSNLKNQIFCHLRIYSFSSGRQTSTLALAIKSQLPCTCSEKMRRGIRQHYLEGQALLYMYYFIKSCLRAVVL